MPNKNNLFVARQKELPVYWSPRIAQAPTTYARVIAAARELYCPKAPVLVPREAEDERPLPRCGGAA